MRTRKFLKEYSSSYHSSFNTRRQVYLNTDPLDTNVTNSEEDFLMMK